MPIMNITSLIPIIPILLLSLFVLHKFSTILKIQPSQERYQSIDGLRGYLALFVFFHHSIVWYFYLWTGKWTFPPSNLYNHMGPTSVGLFFMITSFLFTSKLAEARKNDINWLRLYVGRILRIGPLYLSVLIIILLIVFAKTKWMLLEAPNQLIVDILKWLFFIQGKINNYTETSLIVARVIWSLAFEWLFYFSLPLWAVLLFRMKIPKLTITLALIILFIIVLIIWQFYPVGAVRRSCPFFGGILASILCKKKWIQKIANTHYMSIIISLLLFITIYFYSDAYSIIPYLCMVSVFILITAGNSLFGILTNKYSRLLGQISYSIYLLHGIGLFIVLRCIPEVTNKVIISPLHYWFFIAFLCIILMIISSITYKFIEQPFIKKTSTITKKFEHFLEEDKS